MPCTSTVLPAPKGPASTTRSPGRSTAASASPNLCMSCAVGSRNGPHVASALTSGDLLQEVEQCLVDVVGALHQHHVAAVGQHDQLGVGQVVLHLLRVRQRGDGVLLAADEQHGLGA